jgi:hypothetical protein
VKWKFIRSHNVTVSKWHELVTFHAHNYFCIHLAHKAHLAIYALNARDRDKSFPKKNHILIASEIEGIWIFHVFVCAWNLQISVHYSDSEFKRRKWRNRKREIFKCHTEWMKLNRKVHFDDVIDKIESKLHAACE